MLRCKAAPAILMLSSESVSGLSIQLIDKDEYNKEVAEKMSRVTVITGGTSGIGRGIVEKILANSEQDDLIFATYAHNAYKANDFWDSLKPEDQEKLIIMKADMSSYDDMMNFVKEVKEKATSTKESAKEKVAPSAKVNINKADAETLQKLSGIGEKKAQAIIDYRNKVGKIKSAAELSNIDGIGEATIEKITPFLIF